MTAADKNARFIEAARTQGMLTEPMAAEMLKDVSSEDAASTIVLQRGLMDARQVDMIQTLISGDATIPGYTILDIIGHGGMGVVFRARQEALDREVALKTILVGGRVEEAIQRFRNEATSVARLNHPNIVTAFDSGQHDGRIYFSMELVNGQNLTDYVLHRRQLSVSEALAITRQAALGLAHAWEHRIVHRDIKPDNLLMTAPSEFDQSRTVKITDLGLAHLISDDDAVRLTQAGTALGSPLYMPPEQIRSDDGVDCRSDIYSLGSTLYFMLSGRPPFDGDTVSAVLYNKAAGDSVPLSDVVDVDERVLKLVNWMMESSPDNRPQDYREVVKAIDAISGQASAAIPAPDLAATQQSDPAAPAPPDPLLQNTSIAGTDTSPGTAATPTPVTGQGWTVTLVAAAVVSAAVALYSYLTWPEHSQPRVVERLELQPTWAAPLFDGLTLEGWDQASAGTPWEATTDPVERAFALSGTTRENQSASIRRRIPELTSASAPWFEVEFNVLLDSAQAAGIAFGNTETSSGFRLQVTEQQITLRGEADEVLASMDAPVSPLQHPLHLRVRLQPNGWLTEVNDSAFASAPGQDGLMPEVSLFITGGQAYFSGINAIGLEASTVPQ